MLRLAFAAALGIGTAAAAPAAASEFRMITEQTEFLNHIANRDLRRFGIRLEVTPDGSISGSAFGRDVTGDWNWRGGYFCRDLYFGDDALGPNCQVVLVNGNTVRFVADQGAGDFADFRLR